jgi:proteic killer suppression protein
MDLTAIELRLQNSAMEVEFTDADLDRLEVERGFDAGLPAEVVTAFRRRMQQIRAATDERTLWALKSLHFEKLKGDRAGQRSIRLNKQWRLILALKGEAPSKVVIVIEIVDYHG